jgi:hypothetical protein
MNASLADNLQALFILGDTQAFSDDVQRADDLDKIASWICTNKSAFGLIGVLQVGDLVQSNLDAEWTRLGTAWTTLDGCSMPYFPTLGNHDLSPTTQNWTDTTDATKWQSNVRNRITTKAWWNGAFIASAPGNAVTNTQGRTFWVNIGPFTVMAGEWGAITSNEPGIIGGSETTFYDAVYRQWQGGHPRSGLMIAADHFGPCVVGTCYDFPKAVQGVSDPSLRFNTAVHIGGHVNGISCAAGYGNFSVRTRPDGKNYLAASVDHSCGTRAYDTTPYSWNAILTLNRKTQKLCLRTLRVINASATPATVLGTPDYDRTGTGYNNNETCIDNPGATR